MDRPNSLFTGIFGAFALSCGAMVLLPHSQVGSLSPQVKWEEGQNSPSELWPQPVSQEGRDVYQSLGCFYCHSQQVRDPQNGPDIERGWGPRRTVARDYIYENVPLLGSTRMGPDLANFGSTNWRNEPPADPKKPAKRDAQWIFQHLYNPRLIVSDSKCPPNRFLFETRKVSGQKSAGAVYGVGAPGYEVIPKPAARHLAEYVLHLDRSYDLDEAKAAAKPEEAKK